MILLIDNYDSFTYNLVQMLEGGGAEVQVFRNDKITLGHIDEINPSCLMVSPGPGGPDQAGISVEAIRRFGPQMPVLGVCLGHQSIGAAYGASIIGAHRIMHGKASRIYHDGRAIYRGVKNPFEAIRYHSLIVDRNSLPDCLEVSAWTEEGEIMGLRHTKFRVEGVQFHPESILTQEGHKILMNFSSL